MSAVKVVSFTVSPDRGWSCVTPLGIFQGERGQQVVIVAAENWEQALREAVAELNKPEAGSDE